MKKKKEQNLILQMGMFYLIVILLLGLAFISEKRKEVIIPKVEKKLHKYINKNYSKENIKKNKIKFNKKTSTYTIKVENKTNKDLYFSVTYDYQTKKITSTYKTDYIEGKTLSSAIEKSLNKTLKRKLKANKPPFKKASITYKTKLTDTTDSTKQDLLNKNYNLPLYTINVDDKISKLTEELLIQKLTNIRTYFNSISLNPKDYNITLTNKTEITKSINIKIYSDVLSQDINTISKMILSNNTKFLEEYHIKYKYLN